MPRFLLLILVGLMMSVLIAAVKPATMAAPTIRKAVFAIEVTPDAQPLEVQAGTSNDLTFTAENIGSSKGTFSFTCSRVGSETCGEVSPTGAVLAPQEAIDVTVNFTAGAVGTSGTITLHAAGNGVSDDGSYNISNVTFGVAVTPDGQTTPTREFPGTYSETFTVQNTGSATHSYTMSCGGASPVSCTGVTPASVTLAAGASQTVTGSYNLIAAGTGRLRVSATGRSADSGWYTVPVVPAPPQAAPIVTLRNHNRDNRDRSLCLTAGVGEAAAWQCGDLLVAHGLPGYTTKGRQRSLTLIYNSATAAIRPIVAAAVDENSLQAPATLYAQLSINSVIQASATWTGWGSPAPVRQIVLGFNADSFPTGFYPFTLEVRNQYTAPPGGSYATVINDTLLIVNRRGSEFGRGWGIAGVETITGQPGSRILWTGGDGSVKLYRNVAANTWVAAAAAFRDTLKLNPGDSTYTRTLRHGIQVTFDKLGHHIRTVNRIKDTTTFTWSGTPLRLTSIQVPPGGVGTTYTLSYDGSFSLDRIIDPAGRLLDATIVSSLLTRLIDPDTTAFFTDFGYDASGRMTSRTNRRGFSTKYVYGNGLRVTSDSVRADSFPATWAVTAFEPWDERALGMGTGQSGLVAVDTLLVRTKIDGPRTDVADTAEFWVDRWGAPVVVRDPLGNQTTLQRGNSSVPALVTRVTYPNGRIVGSDYNSRGNVLYVADSTYEGTGTPQTVTTTFVYGEPKVPDSPTEVRAPVDTSRFHYDTALGLVDTVSAQGGHKTAFAYYSSPLAKRGRLNSVTELGVQVVDTINWTKSISNLSTTLQYDSYGNDSSLTSPRGGVTQYQYDAYRRVFKTVDPMNHVTVYRYDLLNRPTRVTVLDPDSLSTQYINTPTGAIERVLDPRQVARSWKYDASDRQIRTIDELSDTAKQYFGFGGLLDSMRTRTGHLIRYRYDANSRLVATNYPDFRNRHITTISPQDSSQTTTILGDSILRTYDAMGRLVQTTHAKDTVTLVYNREGSVRTEHQVVRSSTGVLLSDVTMQYWYDVGGRRTQFFNGTDTLGYSYGANGLLSTLSVQWTSGGFVPDTFRFYWDGLGRRDSLFYARPQANVTFGYDRDGNLRMICARHPGSSDANDYLSQRIRYSTVNSDGAPIDYSRRAGASGASSTCANTPGTTIESASYLYDARHQVLRDGNYTYTYDFSGNRITMRTGVLEDSVSYLAGTNRAEKHFGYLGALDATIVTDSNGWRHSETPTCDICNWRLYYYNSLGQMTGRKSFENGTSWIGGSAACQYDPLGRRVSTCTSGVGTPNTWVAYDGENPVRLVGFGTWRYVHGPGLDDPLVAVYFAGSYSRFYYVTDGAGRLLAFTNASGSNYLSDPTYKDGGNQAGAIDKSNTFANARGESKAAAQLSFYRNRYYDQRTGQWTQEDPIGVAGGINLYQYAGNNPVMFTDPFGLTPCKERNFEDHTDTTATGQTKHDCSKEREAEHERRRQLAVQKAFERWRECWSNAFTDIGLSPERRAKFRTAIGASGAFLAGGLATRADALRILNAPTLAGGLTATQLFGGVSPAVEGGIMLLGARALIVTGLPFAFLGAYGYQAGAMCVFDPNAYL